MVSFYVKYNLKTKLKYFGHTKKENKEFNKYLGSGIYWQNHLKIHGKDILTLKVKEFENSDTEKIKEFGLNFSKENDIVKSKKWANLVLEGGPDCPYFVKKKRVIWNKGLKQTFEVIEKIKKSLNRVKFNGLTVLEEKEIDRLKTTNNGLKIFKNNFTYNQYYGFSAALSRKPYQKNINENIKLSLKNKSEEEKKIQHEKIKNSMLKVEENGKTKRENSTLKQMKTKNLKTKEEKQQIIEKIKKTKLEKFKKKLIAIYDSYDNLIEVIPKYKFDLTNYPISILKISEKNKLYCKIPNSTIERIKKSNKYKFKGFYSLKASKLDFNNIN